MLPRGDETTKRYGPLDAVETRRHRTWSRLRTTMVVGICKIIDGSTPVRQALGGPIMIAQMAGKEAIRDLPNVAMFTVMLSLELGIINLLPVPLLDGGHLLFFVFEGCAASRSTAPSRDRDAGRIVPAGHPDGVRHFQ